MIALNENLSDEDFARASTALAGLRIFPTQKYLVQSREKGWINIFQNMINYLSKNEGTFAPLVIYSAERRDVADATKVASEAESSTQAAPDVHSEQNNADTGTADPIPPLSDEEIDD